MLRSKSEIKSGQGWHARPTLRVSRLNFSTSRMEKERDGFSLCGSPCNRDILSRGCIGRNNSRIPRGHRLRVLRSPGLVRRDTSPRYRIAARVSRSASEDRGVSRKLIPEIEPFVVRPYWCVCIDFVSFYSWNFLAPICWNKYLSWKSLRNLLLYLSVSFTY